MVINSLEGLQMIKTIMTSVIIMAATTANATILECTGEATKTIHEVDIYNFNDELEGKKLLSDKKSKETIIVSVNSGIIETQGFVDMYGDAADAYKDDKRISTQSSDNDLTTTMWVKREGYTKGYRKMAEGWFNGDLASISFISINKGNGDFYISKTYLTQSHDKKIKGNHVDIDMRGTCKQKQSLF